MVAIFKGCESWNTLWKKMMRTEKVCREVESMLDNWFISSNTWSKDAGWLIPYFNMLYHCTRCFTSIISTQQEALWKKWWELERFVTEEVCREVESMLDNWFTRYLTCDPRMLVDLLPTSICYVTAQDTSPQLSPPNRRLSRKKWWEQKRFVTEEICREVEPVEDRIVDIASFCRVKINNSSFLLLH